MDRYVPGTGAQHSPPDIPERHPEATLDVSEADVNLTRQPPNALEALGTGITQSTTEQSTELPNPSLESPFTRWSPILLKITQALEQLSLVSLGEITRLGQVCVFQ